MQLFKASAPPTDLVVTPTEQAIAERDALVALAASIREVKTPEQNQACSEAGSAIQTRIKATQADGLDLRRPYNAWSANIKGVEDTYLAPLLPHLKRLGGLSAVWRVEEEAKVERERQARAAEIARLEAAERKAAEDARKAAEAGEPMKAILGDLIAAAARSATMAAITAPPPEAPTTPGQSFQPKRVDFECTDPIALWNARPDLCNPPTPKASAIKAVCTPEHPVPGLKLWWESKVNFKSR